MAEYDRALSQDTRYEEFFDDPLTRPEARRFKSLNNPDRPQAPLPRALKKSDPIKPILAPSPSPTPANSKKPAVTTSRGN